MSLFFRKPLAFLAVSSLCIMPLLAYGASSIADELTVSGRFDLPKAKPSLRDHITMESAMETNPDTMALTAKVLKASPELLDSILLQAFTKSMRNYGYVKRATPVTLDEDGAGSETEASKLTSIQPVDDASMHISFNINDVQFEETEKGTLVKVVMAMDGPKACFKTETSANYLAITLKDQNKKRKAFAWLGMVALATAQGLATSGSSVLVTTGQIATNDTYFLTGQLNESERLNKISTYGERVAIGEGYPSKRGKKSAQRYALKNAIRLNFARYIALLDTNCLE